MANEVLHAVLLLCLGMTVHVESGGISQKHRCASRLPCFDLLILERLAQHISKDVVAPDGENILLKSQTFDKIREQKHLHSCVLGKIIDFYENVLTTGWDKSSHNISQGMNYHPELISLLDRLRSCTYKVNTTISLYQMNKRCDVLYQKAVRQPNLEILEGNMTPVEAAIYQLQKLNLASAKLSDMSIQERAMDELKSLHNYMPGRGFRKTHF